MNPQMKAYAALFTVYLIWGTTLASMHIGVETIPVLLLPPIRFLMAGFLLVGFSLLRGEKLPSPLEIRNHFIIGLLLFIGGNTVVTWALQYVSTGMAGLLVATTPFCMVTLSALIPPREKISTGAMSGILLGFSGMIILLWPQLTHPMKVNFHFWLAVVAMLSTTFFWSLGSILVRKLPTRSSLLMSVGMQNLLAGLTLTPVAVALTPQLAFTPSPKSVAALCYLVLFGTITATPCYLYVMRHLSVSVASTFAYVTPVVTVIVGALLLDEKITPLTALGAVVILSGVAVVQYMNHRQGIEKPAPEAEPLPEPEQMIIVKPALKGAFFK